MPATRSPSRGRWRRSGRVDLTSDPERVGAADAVVLPGVGAFGDCMEKLRERGMDVCLPGGVLRSGKPFLGVCVALQVIFEDSEESPGAEGLGLLPGSVVRFKGDGLKVPHMGWNEQFLVRDHPVLEGLDGEAFYFVHSYYPEPAEPATSSARRSTGGASARRRAGRTWSPCSSIPRRAAGRA